jgi:peptidyl-tRNA hydrolase, PTH1 family
MVYLVAGLGNPGPRYELTRHNAGFMVVDHLAEDLALRTGRTRRAPGPRSCALRRCRGGPRQAAVVHERIGQPGQPLLVEHYDVPLERMIVVHDEIDLPEGDHPGQERRGSRWP